MRRILVLALVVVVAVGCGDDSNDTPEGGAAPPVSAGQGGSAEPFEFDVTSVDFGYELATAEVPAGPVEVVQTNEGDQEHQVTVIRLADSQTPDDLLQLITDEGDDAVAPEAYAGGANSVVPGGTNSALVTLTPGSYVAYCFLPNHAQQGMVEPFEVTGTEAAAATAEADVTVGLDEFAFDVPDDFTGQGIVEVVNNGTQAHELTIAHAGDNTAAGGLATIGPGETGYVELALEPGDYRLVCFVADPETQQPHFQLGMTRDLTIP